MIVYIEDTLIENFLITYLILNIIFGFINENKSKVRLLLASVFGALIALLYPMLNLNGLLVFFIKMIFGYIITLIAYKTKSLNKQTLFFVMFVFITAIYGGINLMLYFCIYGNFSSSQKLPTVFILFLMFLVTYFLKQVQKRIYQKKQLNNFLIDIEISNAGKNIKTKGYLDSGNLLCDPQNNKPIVLVNYKMFLEINPNFNPINFISNSFTNLTDAHYVEIKTATGKDKLLAFCVDELKIQNQSFKNTTFALSKTKITGLDCDVVLNSKLLKGE